MNYYYSPARLYKIIPKEGKPYFLTLWAYKDSDIQEFYFKYADDDITYMGETELIIAQPWYQPFLSMWYEFRNWMRA